MATTSKSSVGATAPDRRRAGSGGWRSLSTLQRKEALAGFVMLSPAALLFCMFIVVPLAAALVLSLFDWDVLSEATFVGFDNYVRAFGDSRAHAALINTMLFSIASVVLHIGLGLALALAVDRMASRWLGYLTRTAYFFPMLVSWAAVSLLWQYVLDPDFGFVNHYLRGLGLDPPNWFIDPMWALPSLILIDLWKTLGYTFIILLAGLQTVPNTLVEAARVDGAGAWRRLWHVIIPMLSPTLLFASVITFIGAFQIFEPMFIITQGGPSDRTLSVVMEIYNNAFRDFDMGYACALAILLALIIMAVTVVQLRLSRLWVQYDR